MGNVLFPLSYLFGGDKRSYLYPGKNKSQLTPQEQQLEAMYDRIDRPGHRITPQEFFKSPDYAQFLDSQYGPIADKVPPGSQIISQNSFKVEYRDADGYTHVLTRKPDSSGQVTENTDRPAIPINKAQQQFTQELQGRVQQGLQAAPLTLAELDPQTAAALEAISKAEQGANDQQLQELQQQLIARLYGNRVNQSSIANEAGARFAEGAGRVRQQQQSDAAQRTLGLRQLLTSLTQQDRQQQTSTAANLLASLTGQGTQRDIASAGLGLDKERLNESARQFDLGNYLATLQQQLERDKFDRSNDAISQISRLIGVGQQAAGAVSGGLSAYRALTRG